MIRFRHFIALETRSLPSSRWKELSEELGGFQVGRIK